ncbi:carboxymuconolactone decarboxylase family protein [Labedaea rhizosphaerae]|uniref:AhpD family alkylhydroperoxidase n=1 Tax=Labedaea rhizosphaerae TaxID=598644 RepID=A0A4R6SMY2_LABRH|nr:carboxymuconolactone decarboxylase family protein [Labedaea rhizosphaerae]TDQ05678.1 AhpD family alkylhydroperoxidase [Labedaea rhizosphaerae]
MNARINMMESEVGGKFAKRFANASLTISHSALPESTQLLVQIRASQINGCGFCTDMHTKDATAAGETQERLNMIAAWRDATVFTDAERAALALTEEGTRIADHHRGVSDETWAVAQKHFDDEQMAALVCLVAMINAANRMNIITRTPAGSYQPGMLADFLKTL